VSGGRRAELVLLGPHDGVYARILGAVTALLVLGACSDDAAEAGGAGGSGASGGAGGMGAAGASGGSGGDGSSGNAGGTGASGGGGPGTSGSLRFVERRRASPGPLVSP
jgi:hypothetical protein